MTSVYTQHPQFKLLVLGLPTLASFNYRHYSNRLVENNFKSGFCYIRSIAVMEARLPKKAFAMHGGSLPQRFLCQLLAVPRCFPRSVQVS